MISGKIQACCSNRRTRECRTFFQKMVNLKSGYCRPLTLIPKYDPNMCPDCQKKVIREMVAQKVNLGREELITNRRSLNNNTKWPGDRIKATETHGRTLTFGQELVLPPGAPSVSYQRHQNDGGDLTRRAPQAHHAMSSSAYPLPRERIVRYQESRRGNVQRPIQDGQRQSRTVGQLSNSASARITADKPSRPYGNHQPPLLKRSPAQPIRLSRDMRGYGSNDASRRPPISDSDVYLQVVPAIIKPLPPPPLNIAKKYPLSDSDREMAFEKYATRHELSSGQGKSSSTDHQSRGNQHPQKQTSGLGRTRTVPGESWRHQYAASPMERATSCNDKAYGKQEDGNERLTWRNRFSISGNHNQSNQVSLRKKVDNKAKTHRKPEPLRNLTTKQPDQAKDKKSAVMGSLKLSAKSLFGVFDTSGRKDSMDSFVCAGAKNIETARNRN